MESSNTPLEKSLITNPNRLLAVLMMLVPIICNILARQFEPTESLVQMKVQGW
jgi:hypothetical protein